MPTDLYDDLHQACLNTFGVAATLQPQTGTSVGITGIIAQSPMVEDALAGSAHGVNIVYLFVRYVDITPNPQRGDTLIINGVSYDIADVLVDRAGGATLKLRRNS